MIEKQVNVPEKTIHREMWQKLLDGWTRLIDEYTFYPEQEKDIPYWYGERALTGLLSAAAWRLPGCWSLEEFTAQRDSENETGAGRGDLWVGCGKAQITIEAKIIWPKLSVETAIEKTKQKLDEARGQLIRLAKKYRCGEPFSVCYIVPELKNYDREFKEFSQLRYFSRIAENFIASKKCVTAKYEFLKSPLEYKNLLYPGVLLIGREEAW
jgi:hypothetical protein